MTLILPIAFTIITLTRRSDPPQFETEIVPMPELPPRPKPAAADAGPVDAGADAAVPGAGQAP